MNKQSEPVNSPLLKFELMGSMYLATFLSILTPLSGDRPDHLANGLPLTLGDPVNSQPLRMAYPYSD